MSRNKDLRMELANSVVGSKEIIEINNDAKLRTKWNHVYHLNTKGLQLISDWMDTTHE